MLSLKQAKKVLFLDVDGVLNKMGTPVYTSPAGFLIHTDPYCVFLLNKIVDATGCALVLSSSWRHEKDWRVNMKANGVVFDFHSRTTREGDEVLRGLQIAKWLAEHPETAKYAILDDNSWMTNKQAPNFFKTLGHVGLTPDIAEDVIKHLNG